MRVHRNIVFLRSIVFTYFFIRLLIAIYWLIVLFIMKIFSWTLLWFAQRGLFLFIFFRIFRSIWMNWNIIVVFALFVLLNEILDKPKWIFFFFTFSLGRIYFRLRIILVWILRSSIIKQNRRFHEHIISMKFKYIITVYNYLR